MSKRSRKLNDLEQKIHQAILAGDDMTLSQKEVDGLESNATKRIDAINFLLGTGLVRVLKDVKSGGISYRAIGKQEVDVKKGLTGEESLVLNHIQAAGNEGIWTKHLKAKTELHQTVIDRCLKSLVQKQLIKPEKNVKYPTRKIYMLYHLKPSSAITGGPWYTDNELDTEFIKLLMTACLKFIREKSFPKTRQESQALFPLSAAPSYPSAQQMQNFLSKSRITETELSIEDVEMLLNVLVTDGEVEKIPAFGAALWEANSREDPVNSDEENAGKKRKKKQPGSQREKKRRRKASSSESEMDSSSGSDSEGEKRTKGKRSKSRSKSRSRSKKRANSESESNSDEGSDRQSENEPTTGREPLEVDYGGAYVYRAIRQERVALGWSQAPCGRCPQFDFCKDGGPVNPRECEYYGDWLTRAEVKIE